MIEYEKFVVSLVEREAEKYIAKLLPDNQELVGVIVTELFTVTSGFAKAEINVCIWHFDSPDEFPEAVNSTAVIAVDFTGEETAVKLYRNR